MSRIQRTATQAEWDHVAEFGHGRKIARDRWCITWLITHGEIIPSQHGAAIRYCRLIERARGQSSGGRMEAIDGGGGDPHARLWDGAVCAQDAECAMAYVRTQLAGEPYAALRVSILDTALDCPHRTVTQAMRDAGMSVNGRERSVFIAHLICGLDLLALYFDATDAQAERERRRA